jgi:uncharacterized alpha/beta hydrolase family protein
MTSCIMNKLLIALIVVVIGFMIRETIVVTAQSNSTKMDKQKIVVAWETNNKTKTGDVPVISISGEDFWEIFEPLLKRSTN